MKATLILFYLISAIGAESELQVLAPRDGQPAAENMRTRLDLIV